MQNRVVILGTGGTIAGTAASAEDSVGYTAARRSVADLVAAVPALAGADLEAEQVAQVDSKDMSFALWQRLAQRVDHHLRRADLRGIVITHGTDTLEETAYFLHRLLAPAKPVVLTAAMRPATSLQADGPQNLLDAVQVARADGACGVVAVLAGAVHGATDVRKVHTWRLDAFDSGDAGPLARVQAGVLRQLRPWPQGEAAGLQRVEPDVARWPRVEIVLAYASAGEGLLRGLDAVDGVVVACTGNGTVSTELDAALRTLHARGVRVQRSTRCAFGPVLGDPAEGWPSAGERSPYQARIDLLLELLAQDAPGGPRPA